MKKYKLTFKLMKHNDERGFCSEVTAPDNADVQGIKEAYALRFEELYGAPVKCVKVEEV